MDHAPIYQSAENSTPAPLTSLLRGGSFVSAAIALTISGIALGYHGVSGPVTETPVTSDARQASIGVPMPLVSFPRVDGGHPDLIAEISSAIVHKVQPQLPAAAPIPVTLPVFGPPFVLQAPPALTDPVVVPVDILPVADVATPIPNSVTVDTAALTSIRSAPRASAVAQSVDVAGVQVEASAPADLAAPPPAEPPAQAPAPAATAAPAAVRQPTTSPARQSTPAPVQRVVATPEPKPRVEAAPKPSEVEVAAKRPEAPKADAKPTTNDKGKVDSGHGKSHG